MKRLNSCLILSLFLVGFSFISEAQCPTNCSTILTDCSGVGGCPSASCSGNFKVPNFSATLGVKAAGGWVALNSMALCYIPGGTPLWTSDNVVGRIMDSSYLPGTTQTFTTTASNGATFNCTVQPNGLWSVQLISGTAPGSTTTLSGGGYAK